MADTVDDITALIHANDFPKLHGELVKWRPQELAAAFCQLQRDDLFLAFRILPRRTAAAVFEYMPRECQQVLDHVRTHGQNSETLNVIYVVDEAGILIDDIRIREFLVGPLMRRVSDLMDRRFVTLKASDTQESAVEVFRREDRTALPVTDT